MNLNQLFRRAGRQLENRLATLETRLDTICEPVWATSHRGGTLDQWDDIATSGTAAAHPSTRYSHSGSYAAELAITADGQTPQSGVRMSYQGRHSGDWTNPDNVPAAAYYSAWLYIPEPVDVDWWNVMQWKQGYNLGPARTARALYWIVFNSIGGELRPRLATRVKDGEWQPAPYVEQIASSDTPIPVGEWFNLESFYRWDQHGHGQIRTWLNDAELWDVYGLTTEMGWDFFSWNRKPSWNLYGNLHDPATHSVFLDDVAVSTVRLAGWVPAGGW